MQNYFVAEGFAAEVPEARDIVPNINRMAKALRPPAARWCGSRPRRSARWSTGATTTSTCSRRTASTSGSRSSTRSHEGFKVYPKLETLPGDLRVKKIKYSAFIAGSSDIDAQLKARGIETLLVTGTVTNVCCEFDRPRCDDARLPRRHAVRRQCLADRRGARASLNNFLIFFGDVMTTDEAAARLVPVAQRKTA